jgi:hypothetical protein
MPYHTHWRDAISAQQSLALATCIRAMHPAQEKVARAVWRGSTTDKNAYPLTLSNLFNASRVKVGAHQVP